MVPLHLIIVAATEAEAAEFSRPRLEEGIYSCSVIINSTKQPLAAIGNTAIRCSQAEVIGLCHADTSFEPGALSTFTETARAGQVTGIVGIDMDRHYHWSKDTLATVEVSTLDSCSVFFRRDCGLRFDQATFRGFHCHVEDFCLQAHKAGIPVVVPQALASHIGGRTLLPAWQAEYREYWQALARKWHPEGIRFQTT